jgi:hypothetical protein
MLVSKLHLHWRVSLWCVKIYNILPPWPFFFQKSRWHNVPSNYRIKKCCQLLDTCFARMDWLLSLPINFFSFPCNFLRFQHVKHIISRNFQTSKNNLIITKLEKVLCSSSLFIFMGSSLLHTTNDNQLINCWKEWINFVEIMFHSYEDFQWHFMQLELNWNSIQWNLDIIKFNRK